MDQHEAEGLVRQRADEFRDEFTIRLRKLCEDFQPETEATVEGMMNASAAIHGRGEAALVMAIASLGFTAGFSREKSINLLEAVWKTVAEEAAAEFSTQLSRAEGLSDLLQQFKNRGGNCSDN